MQSPRSFKIYDVLLNILLGIFSYLIPKNQHQILLGCNYGLLFQGNSKYFFLYLIKNRDSSRFNKIFWITRNERIYQSLREKKLPVLYLYSFEGFIAILRSYFLITTHTIRDTSFAPLLFGRFNKIQTYHGLPLKGEYPKNKEIWYRLIGYRLLMREKDSYKLKITASEVAGKLAQKYRKYPNFKITGYPRNDIFFNASVLFEDFKNKLNFEQYDKVILYAPTFRDEPSMKVPFTREFLNKLNEYLSQRNYVLLLKNHIEGDIDLGIKNFSNIFDISNKVEDIQNLLINTDILMTDYSSIVLDFVLLEKPMIFYPFDFSEYSKNRPWNMNYFEFLPGPFAKSEDELLDQLKSIEQFFHNPDYQAKFQKFLKEIHKYKDGKSCERLYRLLVEKID